MSNRSKNFTFLIYPENLNKGILESFQEFLLALKLANIKFPDCFISPLHSPSNEDGETKKHYHVLFCFENQKTLSSAEKVLQYWDVRPTKMFIVQNKRSLLRYFLHLDNLEKEQFAFESDDRLDNKRLHSLLTFSTELSYELPLTSFCDREKGSNSFNDFLYCVDIIETNNLNNTSDFSKFIIENLDERAFRAYSHYNVRELLRPYFKLFN